MIAAPPSALIFIHKILQLEKSPLDLLSCLLMNGVSERLQTFLLGQRDAGRHVVARCVLQKCSHHIWIHVATAICISTDA